MAGTSTRLRALLGAAAVLAGLVAVPGASAAPAGRLEVSGAGAASMDLVLRRSSEILPQSFVMQTKGTYAGVALQDSTGNVVAVSMNVRSWIDSRPSTAAAPVETLNVFRKTILNPGRYRLLLLADAPSTVSLKVTGDLIRKVRPNKPYKARVQVTNISNSLTDTGAPAHAVVVPADFRNSRFQVVAHHRETEALQGEVTNFCLTPVGQGYCNPYTNTGGTRLVQNAGAVPGEGWLRSELTGPTVHAPSGYDARKVFDARFNRVAADLPGVQSYALIVAI